MKKINTWAIADEIYEELQSGHGYIFEDLSFDWECEHEDDETVEVDIWFSGEIEHLMSGYQDTYNTAVNVRGDGKITTDGKITIEGKYVMEVGTATYIDELDELRKIESTANRGEEKTFKWTSDNAVDFVDRMSEIPQ